MPQKVLRGFAWFTYPDVFGAEEGAGAGGPGHPFTAPSGEVRTPEEVLYYRPTEPTDTGVRNQQRDNSYLVLSKTQFHPRLCNGWESEPAALSETFKTKDGKVRLVKIVQVHHRHSGDLMECELKVEES
jgi:hypothetical protein